jgi:hypothetical protein
MAINLAFVIAVSKYAGANDLPACTRDGAAMAATLESSGRFKEVLYIGENTTSINIKQKITSFIGSYKDQEVSEVLFYYTGHGEFVGDSFYYLLSDYDPKRRNQTSLENFELDNLIKSLNPSLFSKIVDACHSGVSYIKSSDDIKDYLNQTKSQFKKIYFLFSSQSEQFSYQDNFISYFTESFLKAVYQHNSSEIRYKDIIDYISDDFSSVDGQTPFFVTQADFTEVFINIDQGIKDAIRPFIRSEIDFTTTEIIDVVNTLSAKLLADAKRFCTQEEANQILIDLAGSLTKFKADGELFELYDLEISTFDRIPPNPTAIGKWLSQNKEDKGYFASALMGEEEYQRKVPINDLMKSFAMGLTGEDNFKWVTAKRNVVKSYKTTVPMPYKYIEILLKPRFPNLTPESCYIAPIISRTNIRLFSAFSHFEYVDWEKTQRTGNLEWTTAESPLKDQSFLSEIVSDIFERFIAFVEGPILAKWNASGPALIPDSSEDDVLTQKS